MKTKLLLLLALLGLAARAHAGPPQTYESVVRVTLPVVATSSAIYAFQNTSTDNDVLIRKIEISNASTMTVTGGTMQFWVYSSTSLTHSAAVTSNYSYIAALASQPSFVSVSTAPRNIQAEGDASILSVGGALSGVPPIIRPLYINNDEAATSLLYDSWSERDESVGLGANKDGAQPLVLPANSQRAIVIQQKRLGTADFAAGSVLVRIFYTIR